MSDVDRIRSLDALRGILAVIVLFGHSWQWIVSPVLDGFEEVDRVLGFLAHLAVITFFVLSGWVISLSLEKNRIRNDGLSLSEFAASRFFRIFPPLLFALLLAAALEWVLVSMNIAEAPSHLDFPRDHFDFNPVGPLICLATLCGTGSLIGNVNGPLWSLEYEIQLYVFSGLICAIMATQGRSRVVFALALLVYSVGVLRPVRDGLITNQPVGYLAFAAGFFACQSRGVAKIWDFLANGIFLASALSAVIAMMLLFDGASAISDHMMKLTFIALVSIAITVNNFPKVMSKAEYMGGFSYTMYIIHYPIFMWIAFIMYNNINIGAKAGLILWIPVSIFVFYTSKFVGNWLERPHLQRQMTFELFHRVRGLAAPTGER